MTDMRLGIIRSLLYYPLFPLWREFFTELGYTLVVSPPMTLERFDGTDRRFVGDTCLPIESAFYHVAALRGKVDTVFAPRSNDSDADVYVCPVCAGLPHMLRQGFAGEMRFLSINLTPMRAPRGEDMAELKRLGHKGHDVERAYGAACRRYEAFIGDARSVPALDDAYAGREPIGGAGPRILLLGMPYVLADGFVNGGIPRMLAARSCRISTPLMVAPELLGREVTISGYPIYWSFAGMSLGALHKALTEGQVDGVIYCSSFACGVDSLIMPVAQSACHRCHKIPYLRLVIDEHADPAHLEVRIEAFLDCVAMNQRTAGGKGGA
jgi:predicted nucleotide-binding protein (sugar kinase/HSP70/actin superfamily)